MLTIWVELSGQVIDLARELVPSWEPAGVVELGIGLFVTGGAAFAGLAGAL
jgi:hypothetical protein